MESRRSAGLANRTVAGVGVNPSWVEDRADFAHDVADGAPADLEQFGEGVLSAEFALVEHRGEDTFGVGDLLGEHAAAGAGEAFSAAAAVAVSLVAGVLDVLDACGHRGELGARQSGQRGVVRADRIRRSQRLGLAAGDELHQRGRRGEPQRGREDRAVRAR